MNHQLLVIFSLSTVNIDIRIRVAKVNGTEIVKFYSRKTEQSIANSILLVEQIHGLFE